MDDKYANVYVIITATGMVGKHGKRVKETSMFIIEKGAPGFTFGVKEKEMGIRVSAAYELTLQDCRTPEDATLDQEGKGFRVAMYTLDDGRISIASQTLNLAEGTLEKVVACVEERKQFGRAITASQNTQLQFADMVTDYGAAQLLVYKVVVAKQTQTTYGVEAAKAKLFAADTVMSVTTRCIQLHGNYGYIREYDVKRMMRDTKIAKIHEGTPEMQYVVISVSLPK